MKAATRTEQTPAFSRRKARDGLVLGVLGPLGIYQAARFRDELQSGLAATRVLVLDLEGVTACDLTALQLMCSARRSAEAAGIQLRLAGLSEVVRQVIVSAGLSPEELVAVGDQG